MGCFARGAGAELKRGLLYVGGDFVRRMRCQKGVAEVRGIVYAICLGVLSCQGRLMCLRLGFDLDGRSRGSFGVEAVLCGRKRCAK